MAICIEIKKINESDANYYYHVNTNDFGGADFFIKINKESKEVYFFENNNFKEPVMKYDLQARKWHYLLLSNINKQVLPYVIIKSYKAVKNEQFSNHIGFAA